MHVHVPQLIARTNTSTERVSRAPCHSLTLHLTPMPLSLQTLDFAITCDGHELETHDVKQDGPNSIQAYIASEAGKVIVS